jgi:hypothetical protein
MHEDFGHLFPTNERTMKVLPWLPAHAAIAIVPLHDLPLEMGPTRFLLKSHIMCNQNEKVSRGPSPLLRPSTL